MVSPSYWLARSALVNYAASANSEAVTPFTAILIGMSLSADCFAVALGLSVLKGGRVWWRALRTSSSFGLF